METLVIDHGSWISIPSHSILLRRKEVGALHLNKEYLHISLKGANDYVSFYEDDKEKMRKIYAENED